MKSILTSALIITGFFGSQHANAQNAQFIAGDYSAAIIANPVFDYLGNMFNQNTYNGLYLNSFGITFRNFTNANRSNRFQFDINASNRTYSYPGFDETRKTSSMYYAINYGKEYRKSFINLCVYGGWMAGASISGFDETYSYDNPPTNGTIRQTEVNYGSNVAVAGTGFLGTEYYFSPNFFIGAEVSLRASIGYNFDESNTTEYYATSGNVLVKTTEVDQVDNSFSSYKNSGNPVVFFVGIKF